MRTLARTLTFGAVALTPEAGVPATSESRNGATSGWATTGTSHPPTLACCC